MSGHHSKHSEQMHSPFKITLRKIRHKHQAYCTAYKTHSMATCHRGAGHPKDKDIDLHIEDAETTGLENDNESTSGLDATIALEDQRQKVTLVTLYTAPDQSCQHSWENKWFTPMGRGGRRPTSRKFGQYRKRATKSLSHFNHNLHLHLQNPSER